MLVLGIETSCDETSFAILEGNNDNYKPFVEYLNSFKVQSSVVSSQIEDHKKYGGIVPEIGARLHAQQIHYLFYLLLQNFETENSKNIDISSNEKVENNFKIDRYFHIIKDLEKIYVTTNPGLSSALRIGFEFAKTLKYFIKSKFSKDIDIIEVNHLQGHIFSCFYEQNSNLVYLTNVFPHLHLIVSGGNSQLVLLKNANTMEIIGQTLDDAAGECLDKIGRMLGFSYPGGLNLAKSVGDAEGNFMKFPVSMIKNQTFNYSFSGLKTSVRLFLQSKSPKEFEFEKVLLLTEIDSLKNDQNLNTKLNFIKKVSISVQDVVVTQLINKMTKAKNYYNPATIGISGGVSANLLLRKKVIQKINPEIFIPPLHLTGDNAVMIAIAGLAKEYQNIK
ncbi:MAG: hypothetical protein H7196_00265 [candidate division SR1 bacterium]|nr:hypothetical protein [candidate division SR1 bacterium]